MAKRKSYTPAQRRTILAAAVREKLTATDVRKKFGVTPVTYYSWRKKAGATRRRGVAMVAATPGLAGGLATQLREQVRDRIRTLLPEIVRSEVHAYFGTLFAPKRGRRRV